MANGVVHVRRRSLAGPIILIVIGIFFLLGNFHVLSWPVVGHVFATYWPALLIFAGLVRLFEYYMDQRHGGVTHSIGGGMVFLIILLVFFGLAATTAEHVNWQPIVGDIDVDGDLGIFGSSYTFTHTIQQALPTNPTLLRVVSDRGAVDVAVWDQPGIKVDVTKRVRANSESDAQAVDGSTQPTLSQESGIVTLNANTSGGGSRGVRADLQIFVPRNLPVDISTRQGDVTVRGRNGDVRATTSHGDITVDDVTGDVSVDERGGSVRISKVKGGVSTTGRVDNVSIADVTGSAQLTGDYFGQMTMARISKGLTFRSSRTDFEVARLDGDITIESGDLRATALQGPVRLQTRSKDISLDEITGDVRISNTNGFVRIRAVKGQLGGMEIENQRGDVELTLPAKAAFQVDARTHRGDIDSEFAQISVTNEREDHRATGSVGSGGPKLQITNTSGDINIRKAG